MNGRAPRTGEDGLVAGAEALAFGALVFVMGTLLVVNAWGVIDAKLAVSAAAREATRVLVEAPAGDDATAFRRAELAARAALRGHGKDPARAMVPPPRVEPASRGLARCARVTSTVRYRVPTVRLPWIGGLGGGSIEAVGRHSEIIDPFRSGLPGEADCAF